MPEISIYQTESGAMEVHLGQDTVWLNQAQVVALCGCDQSVISRHAATFSKRENWCGKAICKKCILRIQANL
jgi:hypothetical protein